MQAGGVGVIPRSEAGYGTAVEDDLVAAGNSSGCEQITPCWGPLALGTPIRPSLPYGCDGALSCPPSDGDRQVIQCTP